MGSKKTIAKAVTAHGIAIKKQYGQHFLRDQSVVDHMINDIPWDRYDQVIEIGCGDGFLTKSLLALPISQLRVYELDPEWGNYVAGMYPDPRLHLCIKNVLEVPVAEIVDSSGGKPWVLVANLPYVVTFPILQWLIERRAYIPQGVVMVQEEVAQRLCGTGGREYGFVSLFFQHFFKFTLLDKIPPTAFVPPPKVTSRLVSFVAYDVPENIPDIDQFWVFIKRCFSQPRRMLRNNLAGYTYPLERVPEILDLRAQQIPPDQLIAVWKRLQ